MKPLTAWIALLLLSSAAFGGEEPPSGDVAAVLARLRSDDAGEVAWGAYVAGRDDMKEAVPLLLDVLRPRPERSGKPWPLVHRSALDALIRLEARVPPGLLEPHLHGRSRLLAFLLAAREPRENGALLLSIFDRDVGKRPQFGITALAAGNLLCANRTPGFAARLMSGIRVSLELTVHDGRPSEDLIGIGGGAGGRFSDGRVDQPEDFPPYALYRLVPVPRRPNGPAALADGPRPVHFTRRERSGRTIGFGGLGYRFPRPVCIREWLAAMAETTPKALGLPELRRHVHVWESPDAFLAWAVARRDELQERYWALARRLVKAGALSAREARALTPGIEVTLIDDRKETTDPIPRLPPTTVEPRLPEPRPERQR
jgi:hypothetical protein